VGVGGVALFVRDKVEEPVGCLLLPGEGYSRENGRAKPGVPGLGKSGAQELERFECVGLGYGRGSFCGRVILECEELRGPTMAAGPSSARTPE
jgi:hypothetical protein